EAVRRALDPEGRRPVGLYLGAGADLSNFFLSTNVDRAFFLAQNYRSAGRGPRLTLEAFRQALKNPAGFVLKFPRLWAGVRFKKDYSNFKRVWGYAFGPHVSTPGRFLAALVLELKALGVDPRSATPFESTEGNLGLRFLWSHPGEKPRERTVVFIDGTAASPVDLERTLQTLPPLDVVYQRAGELIPLLIEADPRLVAVMNRRMAPGGRFAINPYARNWGSRQTIDRKIVFPFPLLEVSIPEEESRAARVTERQLRAAGALDLLDDTYPRDNPYGFRMAIREAAPEVDLLAEERVPSAVLDWFDGDVAMDGASSESVEALARESVRWARDAQSAVLDLLRTAPLPPETRAAVEPLVLDYLSRYSADHPRSHDFSDLFPRARRWMGGDPAVNFTDHRVRGKLGLSDDDVFIDTLKALLVFREAAHQLGAGANARRPLAERLDVLHRQYLRLRLARALLARPGLTIPAEASFIARTIDEAFARVRESIDWTDRSMDYVDVPALLEGERSILEEETAGGYVAVRLRVAPDVEKLGKVFAYDGLLLTGLRHFVQEAIEVASRRAPAEVEWVTVQLSMTRANEIRVGVRTTFKREGSWTVDNRFQSALDSVGGDWGPRTGDPNREAWFPLPVLNAPVPNLSWKNRLVIV
ncbi:MAG TPA: hypothetical protein PLM37_08475, partial [Elusimicrobiota bacterium]|nr:hypothetical protein [Elusimicrobiota bacterium]